MCYIQGTPPVCLRPGGVQLTRVESRSRMALATTIPAQLVTDILDALKRLREARIDGDPNHSERLCTNCYICASQRWLNILIDRLPREKTTT